MSIVTWIIVGLIAGVLAKALMPGMRDEPSGWLGTIGLGILGALLGGYLSQFFLGSARGGMSLGGIFTAVVGACLLIALLRLLRR